MTHESIRCIMWYISMYHMMPLFCVTRLSKNIVKVQSENRKACHMVQTVFTPKTAIKFVGVAV